MFDLEGQIQAWRQTLPRSLGDRAEAVDELESHLREEFQRLVQLGQTPERAWITALDKLGTPQQLAGEFGKLPPAPAAWLPGRLVLFFLGAIGCLTAALLLSRLLQGDTEPLLGGHIFAVTLGYTAMFGVGILGVWSLLVRVLRGWDDQRAATLRYYALRLTSLGLALTIFGVVLGAWWARDHLGRLWGWDVKELGGLAVLAWYGVILACLSRRLAGWLVGILVAVAGNIVVSLSWFGPPVFGIGGLHSYGAARQWPYLAGFLISQVLILLLGFVPARRITSRRA